MHPIGKNDLVILGSSEIGMVTDVINSDGITVFKISRLSDNNVVYMEANMVLLKNRCRRNSLMSFSYEIAAFLAYIMALVIKRRGS